MEKIIQCNNITHYYGERLIYENLNFEVERGKILGLLGKNGTGKTTIINILNGYLKPRSGECKIFGENMQNIQPQTKARVGLLLEGHIGHSYFNVKQVEKFYSRFFPNWKADAYYRLTERLKISDTQKIATMSCGQRSQIALGLLFAQDPDLLILDDFSMGLDPGYRRLFVEYLRDYVKEQNKTIFLTSHIIQDMEMLIDDCMILDYGKLLIHKPTQEILDNFKRYTFSCDDALPIDNSEIYNLAPIAPKSWECYSFLSEDKIAEIIPKAKELSGNTMNLEDAFIGLTGKY